MVAEVFSAMIQGIEGQIVKIQVDISNGLPNFNMIGYLSNEVKESKERVRTALNNIGVLLPPKRISVNFAPADFRKCGTSFDIGVAAAILLAMDFVPETYIKDTLFVGELSLNGQICPISGVLPIVVAALKVQSPLTLEQLCQIIQEKLPGSCVPKDNLKEDVRLVIPNDSSFIIEYTKSTPETKLLFSVAHELGHLILHFLQDNGSDKLKTKESVNIGEVEEYEANEFAAYLLMPDKQFISKCKQFSENGMISINKFAEYFHVSNRTAIVRGMALGLW